jgi:hypothetical protein
LCNERNCRRLYKALCAFLKVKWTSEDVTYWEVSLRLLKVPDAEASTWTVVFGINNRNVYGVFSKVDC